MLGFVVGPAFLLPLIGCVKPGALDHRSTDAIALNSGVLSEPDIQLLQCRSSSAAV